jgi:hypothetical protein
MVGCISKNLALGRYPSSNVFFFKTTFRKLGEGVAPTLLEKVSLNHWTPSHKRRKTYKHLQVLMCLTSLV